MKGRSARNASNQSLPQEARRKAKRKPTPNAKTTTPEALENKVEGIAVIQFIVEKDGSIEEMEIARDPGYGLVPHERNS
jgi:outer membrane biosynthesis protein TonB